MRGLSLRLSDGRDDRHVTRAVRSLSYRHSAYGGHVGASFRLDAALGDWSNLGPNSKVWVYSRAGQCVFEGFLNSPGREDAATGEGLDVTALGVAVLLSDVARPLRYVDSSYGEWRESGKDSTGESFSVGTKPGGGGEDSLVFEFAKGTDVNSGDQIVAEYRALRDANLNLGGVGYSVDHGVDGNGWETQLVTAAPGGGSTIVRQHPASTTENTGVFASAGGGIPVGDDVVRFRFRRVGADIDVSNKTTWSAVRDVWVRQLLRTRDGGNYSGSGTYTIGTVLASQVIEDMLGRDMLAAMDGPGADVAATSFAIDQFVFERARAQDVLEALRLFEDVRWAVGPSTAAGHRFSFGPWPTQTRFVITGRDDLSLPGQENTLCNRVFVTWRDRKGRPQSRTVYASVQGLAGSNGVADPTDSAFTGRLRDADTIDLPDGLGSDANALRVGTRVLNASVSIPMAGSATFTRPVVDIVTQRLLEPAEVAAAAPGWPVWVAKDGVALRCTEAEYSHDDRSVKLTLEEPRKTREQVLARLARGI